MTGIPHGALLKEVSRSFHLSLCLLPAPMRGAASLGYLLARASDTIADSATAPAALRLESLAAFSRMTVGEGPVPRWPLVLLNGIPSSQERRLLESMGELLDWLELLPRAEAALVREVVKIITSGQELDLRRFGNATRSEPLALADDAELEDYAWRVAGCVGAFWTKLGFLTMAERFSKAPESELLAQGIAYGKGLQLVNILRDLPADLAMGRCYLPVAHPSDIESLMACHARWLERAGEWLHAGQDYALRLASRRLRAASGMPSMIGLETLDAMRGASWNDLSKRIKIGRGRVYLAMLVSLLSKERE